MPAKHPTLPAKMARKTLLLLKENADLRLALQGRGYFKADEKVALLGIRAPRLRAIESEIYRSIKPPWDFVDALAFCDILVRNPYLEAKAVGIILLSRCRKKFTPVLFEIARGWLEAGCCDSWAATDALSTMIVAPLIQPHPELVEKLRDWTESPSLWVRRASAVALTPLARKGLRLDQAYAIGEMLMHRPEDLIHKAVGWLLRECGKTDAGRLESFLISHIPRLPRTALRYAIERFPPDRRQRLLRLERG